MTVVLECGEFVMTSRDFAVISKMMMEEAGIVLGDNKVNLVYSRLGKRLRKLGLPRFSDYCDLISTDTDQGRAERGETIAALTTNVTRFYREPHHFEHLATRALPGLVQRARRGATIRLWSAACSSGPEAYSMALTLMHAFPDVARHDVKILGTDIDPNVLQKAQAGSYEISALDAVPAELRRRWFAPCRDLPGNARADQELRDLMTFRRLNLIGDWPMKGKFQVVFCRNVVIYFDAETQSRLWSRIATILEPGGFLYIGHSERVSGPADMQLKSDGITIYQRLGKDGLA